MQEIKKGDLVKLKLPILGNPEGTLGAVYEEYDLSNDIIGVSVIFENGEHDGFSIKEQAQMLDRQGHDEELEKYNFKNVRQLAKDFDAGVFNVIQ